MLRRFSVKVDENNRLDIDINRLRAKVVDLFSFSSDTDFILTYVDDDGDVVTLVNDDDLDEMMNQHLSFLKINVHLRNKEKGQSHNKSDGSSTRMTSERSFQNVCTGISEVLKSMPEPLPEFCSQLLLDIASKAVTSPVLSELAQSFIRLGNPNAHTGSRTSSVPEASTQNVATECPMPPLGADSRASKNDDFHQEAGSKFQCSGSSKNRKIINSENVTKNTGEPIASGLSIGKPAIAARSSNCFDRKEKEKHNDAFLKLGNSHCSPATSMDRRFINECPFSGMPWAPQPYSRTVDPVSSSSGNVESAGSESHKGPIVNSSDYIGSGGNMFHKGVICDGCGARPITGPRFKSRV